jgi:PDZ domain-containing protein
MHRRSRTLLVASALAVFLLLAALTLPVPYVSFQPGPVTDTLGRVDGRPLISIQGRRTYPTNGKLQLTTVEERRGLTLLGAVRDWFARDKAVVPLELVQPPDLSEAEIRRQNTEDFLRSQDDATAAALAELGVNPVGVVVAEIPAGSPSTGRLRVGDQLEQVDGRPVADLDALRAAIGRVEPGGPVRLSVLRDRRRLEVTVETRAAPDEPDRPVIGVQVRLRYPFAVDIQLEDVGGPSAGLMFALGIIDLLTPAELTGGRVIAGTGTITADGQVGSIGGVQQKLQGARRAGASVFLVPADNCAEASRAVPDGLRLVRVDDLDDALADLEAVRGGRPTAAC